MLICFGIRGFIFGMQHQWQLEIPDGGCVLGQPADAKLFPKTTVTPTDEVVFELPVRS